jgi:hypothetical protein
MKFITLACFFFLFFVTNGSAAENIDYAEAKKQITLREIGHRLLLFSGDSTSRVLPIKQLSENEYQIQFASQFSFRPGSLVSEVEKSMKAGNIKLNYVVNVVDSKYNQIVYGYSVAQTKQTDLVVCRGRVLPKSLYYINVIFPPAQVAGTQTASVYVGGFLSASLLILSVAIYKKRKSPVAHPQETITDPLLSIGSYKFDADQRLLVYNDQQIELTDKESKLLKVFAVSPNTLIDRKHLLKIWEDEGVIVGRSLDVFVSKLRKKLDQDLDIKLVNIHGRGYKLEIA